MADCNIRNIDSLLMARLKVRSAKCNTPMRECVITAITHWLDTHDTLDAKLSMPLGEFAKKYIEPAAQEEARIMVEEGRATLSHAPNCKCFICNPPKEK